MQRWRPKSRILRAKVIIYFGSSFVLVPSQAPLGMPFFKILYFIWGLLKNTSVSTFPPSTTPHPPLFPPHGPLPSGIMGTYGPASTYRALNNCCNIPARCTNLSPPLILNTPGLSWSSTETRGRDAVYLTDGERGRDTDKCCVNRISGEIFCYWRVFRERRRWRVQTFHVMLIYSRPVIWCRVDALICEEAVSDGAFLPHQQPDVCCSFPLSTPQMHQENSRV